MHPYIQTLSLFFGLDVNIIEDFDFDYKLFDDNNNNKSLINSLKSIKLNIIKKDAFNNQNDGSISMNVSKNP